MDLSEMNMNIAIIHSNMPLSKRAAIEFDGAMPAVFQLERIIGVTDRSFCSTSDRYRISRILVVP
jgi:hypothetical protein